MTKATKVEAGHYTYGAHTIKKVGNHWHVFKDGREREALTLR